MSYPVTVPKFSVYVPDDLWDRARKDAPGSSTSQLVQDGLRCLAQRGQRPIFEPPEIAPEVMEGLRESLRAKASASYRAGYARGIAAASKLDWETLDLVAQCEWDLQQIGKLADWRTGEPVGEEVVEALTSAGLPTFSGAVLDRGWLDALRAVWQLVLEPEDRQNEGTPGTGPVSSTPTSGGTEA
jgi:hypothetical protein